MIDAVFNTETMFSIIEFCGLTWALIFLLMQYRRIKRLQKGIVRAMELRLAPDDADLVSEYLKAPDIPGHKKLPKRDLILKTSVKVTNLQNKTIKGQSFVLPDNAFSILFQTDEGGTMQNVSVTNNTFDTFMDYATGPLSFEDRNEIHKLIKDIRHPHSTHIERHLRVLTESKAMLDAMGVTYNLNDDNSITWNVTEKSN